MNTTKRYSPEVRERAVRLVIEQRSQYPSLWATICSIASKMGCTPETLRAWCKHAEGAQGAVEGSILDRERLTRLERENKELKRANEILRQAAAFFAQAELDRKPK